MQDEEPILREWIDTDTPGVVQPQVDEPTLEEVSQTENWRMSAVEKFWAAKRRGRTGPGRRR
jgi:hypothetical protein